MYATKNGSGGIITSHLLWNVACVALLFSLASCNSANGPVIPGFSRDQVYSADGGFIITQKMLNTPYNRITFPATHNSFAGPDWDEACGNQRLTIAEQLQNGIRCIEIDMDKEGCASHNGYCTQPLEPLLNDIREYVRNHPNQVFTVRVSDLACDRRNTPCDYIPYPANWVEKSCFPICPLCCCSSSTPDAIDAYEVMNVLLERTGLSAYIYNWDASIAENRRVDKCYVPVRWPTLGEMIRSRKNVMLFHNRELHDIVDSGYFRGLNWVDYNSGSYNDGYGSYQLADLSKLQPVWAPGICARQRDGPNRLFLLECNANTYKACITDFMITKVRGDCPQSRRSCNDGRRLYQLAKQHEDDPFLLPGDRVVNFIAVDYFLCTDENQRYFKMPVNVVDACNRLNYERMGFDWRQCTYAWDLQPHEVDQKKVEYTQQNSMLRKEVDEAISDFKFVAGGLSGNEVTGAVRSTPAHRQISLSEHAEGFPTDWWWLPEWAVDGDYYTAWRGSNWGGAIVIDLQAKKTINELAIAWKYSRRAPGYNVFASNDDVVMHNLPSDAAGWKLLETRHIRTLNSPQMWDIVALPEFGWRYIKIEVTEGGDYWGSAIFELRVYGPRS